MHYIFKIFMYIIEEMFNNVLFQLSKAFHNQDYIVKLIFCSISFSFNG